MPTITIDVPAGALSALRLSPTEFVKEMRVTCPNVRNAIQLEVQLSDQVLRLEAPAQCRRIGKRTAVGLELPTAQQDRMYPRQRVAHVRIERRSHRLRVQSRCPRT